MVSIESQAQLLSPRTILRHTREDTDRLRVLHSPPHWKGPTMSVAKTLHAFRLSHLTITGLFLLAGCGASRAERYFDLEQMAKDHDKLLIVQEMLEAKFAQQNPLPQRMEFEGKGTLLISKCQLGGRLGREEVNVQLTYVNDTGEPIRSGHITIAIIDPESGVEHTLTEEMILPFGLRFHSDSTYTTQMDAPTYGLHRIKGWQWEARIHVEFYPPEEE
ncbi:MAG: hypothetical protein ACI841_000786 [Planctomycetota bacterium]|jgi:hypothetical protein